jgi:hypothetical protein
MIADVHARSGTDGFLAEWLAANRLDWAAEAAWRGARH